MSQPVLALSVEMVNVLRPLTDRPPGDFAKKLMVLELYRQRQISSGKAAELLEMERAEFIRFAGRQGIAFFDISEDEFAREMENVDRYLRTS